MILLPNWITPNVKQTWIALPPLLNKISYGMAMGFTTSLLDDLNSRDSLIKVTLESSSWIVSSISITALLSYLSASLFMVLWGRRTAYIVHVIPGLIGLVLLVCAADVSTLIAGRACIGLTASNALIGGLIIGEYCSPQNRGMFLNMKIAFLHVGNLIAHILGNYLHWRTVSGITIIPLALCLIIACTCPESPFWLAEKKEFERSEEIFYWLRGETEESTKEIKELIVSQQDKKTITFWERTVALKDKFKTKNFWQPMFIMVIIAILVEVSGRHIFPSYAAQITKRIVMDRFDPFYFYIFIDVLIAISGLTASFLVRVFKMRNLLFSTGFAAFLVLNLACLSLYLLQIGTISSEYSSVPLVLFALYFLFSNLGCTCIPMALVGEILPLEHKSVGTVVYGAIGAIVGTIGLKITPQMMAAFDVYGTFSIFSIFIFVALAILYFILPETKNKTLLEIETFYVKKA